MSEILRIGFLCSHRGSNMQSVVEACRSGELHAYPAVVIANNSRSGALDRARDLDIPVEHLSRATCPDPDELDRRIRETLQEHRCDLVVLAGYMRKLGPETLGAFANRVLNIHPALLPKFGGQGMYGQNVHEAVIAAGESITGITIHCVDQDYDTGPILAQKRVAVEANDTPESLAARLLPMEHAFLVETLERVASGELALPAPAAGSAPGPAPRLLVSVRNRDEAVAAFEAGAAFIDIKEPAQGSLGRASPKVLAEVAATISGATRRAPTSSAPVTVSAALGELVESEAPDSFETVAGITLYKFGLSRCQGGDWEPRLDAWRARLDEAGARLVAVAYADHKAAGAPAPHEVLRYATGRGLPFLLVDTFEKNGHSLTDRLTTSELRELVREAHQHGLAVALAGSLRCEDLAPLAALEPEVLAVRSAACVDGDRGSALSVERVEKLVAALNERQTPGDDPNRAS